MIGAFSLFVVERAREWPFGTFLPQDSEALRREPLAPFLFAQYKPIDSVRPGPSSTGEENKGAKQESVQETTFCHLHVCFSRKLGNNNRASAILGLPPN